MSNIILLDNKFCKKGCICQQWVIKPIGIKRMAMIFSSSMMMRPSGKVNVFFAMCAIDNSRGVIELYLVLILSVDIGYVTAPRAY